MRVRLPGGPSDHHS